MCVKPLGAYKLMSCKAHNTRFENFTGAFSYTPPFDDHDAADAGGMAAGFDFGDAARMAAEFAPILGGAPAGQRRH